MTSLVPPDSEDFLRFCGLFRDLGAILSLEKELPFFRSWYIFEASCLERTREGRVEPIRTIVVSPLRMLARLRLSSHGFICHLRLEEDAVRYSNSADARKLFFSGEVRE